MTVLSQHTSDVNSARAFESLKVRFQSWEQVQHAPDEELADAIRSGGIANLKARRIKRILDAIEAREGGLDLARLAGLSDEDVDAYLRSLPGVGRKTSACVLLFSMGRAAFPVDTHVQRVAGRLGLVPEAATADEVHEILGPRVPPELCYEFHIRLVRHGRDTCTARRPRCGACILFDLCDAGPRFVTSGEAR
ncbi:MAG: endonuclease III [Actinomycetota bacterium]